MIIHPVPGQPPLVLSEAGPDLLQFGPQLIPLGGAGLPDLLVGAQPLTQLDDLETRQMHPQRLELGHQVGVAPGRLGLLLQGSQSPPHL